MYLDCSPQIIGVSTLKQCPGCGQVKPRDQYFKCKGRSDGLQVYCIECIAEYRASHPDRLKKSRRKYYYANRESILEKSKVYGAEHRDHKSEYNREYYQNNKDAAAEYKRNYAVVNRERVQQRRRAYYIDNRDVILQQKREYYINNRTMLLERDKDYRENNREIINRRSREYGRSERGRMAKRVQWHVRRARKSQNGGQVTSADIEAVRKSQTDKRGRLICWACGYPIIGNEPPPHKSGSPPMPPHLDHWIPLKHGGRNDAGNLHYMHGVCNLSKSDKLPTELGRLL